MLSTFTSLAYWVNNLDPFVIHFPKGSFVDGIRWYGLAYVISFLIAFALLHLYYQKKRSPYNPDQQTTLITAIILGTLIGGRLGYMLLYDLHNFLHNPFLFFKVNEGGMASHGGILGILIALIWFARKTKTSLLALCDIIASIAPLGAFFGRIANFINGELWGKITYVKWAVIFPTSAPGFPLKLIPPRHPSQLYEAALEGLLLFIYIQFRFWTKGKTLPKGQLTGECFIGYAIARIICEFFRTPDAPLILHINPGQFYSIFLIIAGLIFIFFSKKKHKSDHHSRTSCKLIKPENK
ncbi:MAG: prolipoprotein diacylglyceryl transferase [Verrucomicrobia bacterium]|nr:MAG: prolipoprotein diacylglyceryl transferase [Verrucomicrobiota bacterium]